MFVKRMRYALMCGSALIAVASLDAAVGGALAQPLDSEPESVTVTGTMISGVANPVGSNLVSMDAADIRASGAMTTNEVLSQLPMVFGAFNTHAVEGVAIAGGTYSPSIRTGVTGTLSLLNGNNVVGVGGLGTNMDPGLIPVSVLSRVDVLPDGASTLYGANAIAGVINFVTRDRFEGFEANATLGVADGYSAFDGNVLAGTSWSGGGGGGAYLAFEHKSNTYLMDGDRSYMAQDLTGIGGRDTRGTACALPNITANGKNYALTSNAVANTPGALAAAVTGPLGGLDPVTNAGSINRCDNNANTSLFPKSDQNGIFGQVHQHVMRGVEFSANVLWNSRADSAKMPMLSTSQVIDNTNPYFQSIAGETSQTVQLNFAPFYGFNGYDNRGFQQIFQVVPKLSIELPFGDWHADLLMNYGRGYTAGYRRNINSALLQESLRQMSIGGTQSPGLVASSGAVGNAVDPYNLALGNPGLLQNILDVNDFVTNTQHQLQYQGIANGTLFDLPGGPVKAAIGGKYSWEDYVAHINEIVPIGDIGGPPPVGDQDTWAGAHRVTESGFAEINVPIVGQNNRLPLVHALTFSASGRFDNYSDFGNTANFKLGFSYDPFASLTIRGTDSTAYNAPSLGDTVGVDSRWSYATFTSSPNTTVPPGTSAADALRPSISLPGGDPNLGPERGHDWSIGADFHPTTELGVDLTGLDLGATVWHDKKTNQIGTVPYTNSALFFTPSFAKYYITNPTLAQLQAIDVRPGTPFNNFPGTDLASAYGPGTQAPYIFVDLRRHNLGIGLAEGVDLSANYTKNIDGFGIFTAALDASINTKNDTQVAPGLPWTSTIQYGIPKSAWMASVQTITGALTARAWVQFSPGFNIAPTAQAYTLYHQTSVGDFHPVNMFVSYEMGDMASWLGGTTASVTVTNIGDEAPPQLLSGGTAFGSTLGRYTELSLRQEF